MEEAEGPELTVKSLATYILAVNVAAIHVRPDAVSLHTYAAQILRFCD
jgi:hypothetical protein